MARVNTMQKNDSKAKIDSFIERRMLFKNIWETAMKIDEKEEAIMKPKIIKTLRLNEMANQVMTKTKNKKQRIKNLRHVCNKLLDFCDKQDADDLFYEQLVADEREPGMDQKKVDATIQKNIKVRRKIKKIRRKKRERSTFAPSNEKQAKPSVSDPKDKLSRGDNAKINTSNKKSPNQIKKKVSDKMKAPIKKYKPKPKKSGAKTYDSSEETKSSDASAAVKRKVVKKKRILSI